MDETLVTQKTKRCLYCNNIISGRTDKSFCDDRCRNNYYYKVNNNQKKYIREINGILLRNRGILRSVNPYGRMSVPKSYLDDLGFNFDCYTGIYRTKKGKDYYLVYDQAYSYDEEGKIGLVVFYRNH